MNPSDIVALNHARTTFQRISDGKFFNGWVELIWPDVVVAQINKSVSVTLGEEFAFHIYGNGQDAFFHATLLELQNATESNRTASEVPATQLTCEVSTEITFSKNSQQPRFSVEGVSADVELNGKRLASHTMVIDIGPRGLAVLVEHGIKRGEVVEVSLFYRGQVVRFEGEVRNCIGSANAILHRVGLEIKSMNRVDAIRWKQVYISILEANKLTFSVRSAEIGRVAKLRFRKAA